MAIDTPKIIHFEDFPNEQDFFVIDGKAVTIFQEMESGNTNKFYLTHKSMEQLILAYEEYKAVQKLYSGEEK